MTAPSPEFFGWLDEQPQTPEGVLVKEGRETRVRPALSVFAEFRARNRVEPQRSFPEVERRRNQLTLLTHTLEKEELK